MRRASKSAGEIRFGTPMVLHTLPLSRRCQCILGRIARSKLEIPRGDGRRQVTVFALNRCPRSKLTAATDDPVERIRSARSIVSSWFSTFRCSTMRSRYLMNPCRSRNLPNMRISTRRRLSRPLLRKAISSN